MVALSRNVSPKQAMEMLLLGEMVTAPRAYEIGLINRLVAPQQLEREVQAMAAKLATKSPMALKTGKRAFYEQLDRDLDSAYAYCSQVMVENTLTDDAQEGIEAFLAKRPPVWRGT
jgi:enoyl-CoA hydratase/carnithine racemase